MRRRAVALGLVVLTVGTGIAWRMVPMGLSAGAWKYGGSALYGAMLYWMGVAAWPREARWKIGVGAYATSVAVECFKLVRAPGLDAFRMTLAGKLVLGRVFTSGALIAYGCGVVAVFALDSGWRARTG